MDQNRAEKAIVSVNSQSQQRSVSQNAHGGSSMALRAATSNAVASPSTADRAVATRCNLAQFGQALENCRSKFGDLGRWLSKQVEDNLENLMDALNIPKMFEDFKKLTPLQQVLIVIVILALGYLLHMLAWEAVSFVWPYVMQFIESDTGVELIQQSTAFLESFVESDVMISFNSIFATAAIESEASPDTDTPCFGDTNFQQLVANPSMMHIDVFQAILAWFTNQMTRTS